MLTPRFEGTLLCKCGKLIKPDQDAMNRIKETFEILEAPYYRTSPISKRGSKSGPKMWQQHHHKARDAIRSATKGDRGFISIWDGWQNAEIYRESQLAQYWSDAWVRYLDHIVQFSIHHNATQQQRESTINVLYLRSVDENRQAPPLSQRPGYWEAKKESINLQKARREELAPIDPSLQKYLEWLSTKLGRICCRRTSSVILLIPLVTKLNLVEFVFMDFELAEMASAQLAGRQIVRTMVSETTSNSRFRRSRTSIQETGASRLKTTSSTLSPSTRKSDRSLVLIKFFLQKLLNLSFALSQWQQP